MKFKKGDVIYAKFALPLSTEADPLHTRTVEYIEDDRYFLKRDPWPEARAFSKEYVEDYYELKSILYSPLMKALR